MRATRYSTSRQKACQHCSSAKTKCDRRAGGCSRCTHRSLQCSFSEAMPPAASTGNSGVNNDAAPDHQFAVPNDHNSFPIPEHDLLNNNIRNSTVTPEPAISSANNFSTPTTKTSLPNLSRLNATSNLSEPGDFDFSDLRLVCPINADEISNRWLNAYIPVAGQTRKDYPTHTTAFVYRILKSYIALVVRGRGIPPFVHFSQMTAYASNPPLSACFSLVRICEKPLPGSEGIVADVLEREMNNIYGLHGMYNDMTLLAAFQAYLIYTMVLFFQINQGSNTFLRQAVINLQQLACMSSRQGLVCSAEQTRTRPKWESWIVAEAKRRTLYTMYLFDSVLSIQDGLPTYLATELRGLPAPANKSLWKAQARKDWEKTYNIHLADWLDGDLCIDELWPIPEDLDEIGTIKRRHRVDEWLQNIDEFGTMLYAVTSGIHGG